MGPPGADGQDVSTLAFLLVQYSLSSVQLHFDHDWVKHCTVGCTKTLGCTHEVNLKSV